MRVQIVLHQHDFLDIGIHDIDHVLNRLRVIFRRATLGHQHFTSPGERFADHEQIPCPVALIFVIDDFPAARL